MKAQPINNVVAGSSIPPAEESEVSKNVEIESLRTVAILLVIFQHSFNYLTFWVPHWAAVTGAYFNLGQAGVDLFFSVSGYVIARSFIPRFASAETSLAAWKEMLGFWVKRIYRLWPTVFLWVFLDVVLSWAFNRSGAFGSLRANFVDGISAVAQVANFHHAYCIQSGACFANPVFTLGPLWSLSLEEQFYVVFPILLCILHTCRKMAFLPIILILVAIPQIFLARPDGSSLLYLRTDALCGGVLIFLVSSWDSARILREPLREVGHLTKAIVIFFLLLVLTSITGRTIPFNAGVSAVISTAIVLIAHYEAGWFILRRGSTAQSIVRWIAERSFSIYVIHCVAIALTREIWWRLSGGLTPNATYTLKFYLSWIVIMVLLSEPNWRYVESPLRMKGRQIAAEWFSTANSCAQI